MSKFNFLIGISLFSGVIAILKEFFGDINTSYIILLIILGIDTLSGMAAALKFNSFSSRGLMKLVKKTITYSTAILTVKLLEFSITSLVETTMLSQIMVIFLQVTEVVSILENLTMLGVPLPSGFISLLLKYLRIPGLNKAIELSRNTNLEITEIEDIIKYQLPAIEDKDLRKLLEIKFDVWKSVAFQLNKIMSNSKSQNKKYTCYKVSSVIKLGLKEIEDRWRDKKVPQELIDRFKTCHREKTDKFVRRVENICYSTDSPEDRKEQVIDSIVVILYQTILDAHKLNGKPKTTK